jgi:translation initiation factor 2 gamma subunit (eIF-2gamma)
MMHQGHMGLETIIEDEFLEYNLESKLTPEEIYDIEFDDRYLFNYGLFELEDAIEKIQESAVEPDIIKPVITEIDNKIEIVRQIPTEYPYILRYLNPE